MPSPYHSALDTPLDAPKLSGFTRPNGTAFVHDIMSADQLPDAYMTCDVLYLDPPWKTGYRTFTERCCITDAPTYDTFMWHVVDLIDRSALPAVVVAGKQAAKYLNDGFVGVPVRLQRFEAIAYYRDIKPLATSTAVGILEGLARQFDVVGDFFCGYGSSARAFTLAGKGFVASDCNPQCISVMAERLPPMPG